MPYPDRSVLIQLLLFWQRFCHLSFGRKHHHDECAQPHQIPQQSDNADDQKTILEFQFAELRRSRSRLVLFRNT